MGNLDPDGDMVGNLDPDGDMKNEKGTHIIINFSMIIKENEYATTYSVGQVWQGAPDMASSGAQDNGVPCGTSRPQLDLGLADLTQGSQPMADKELVGAHVAHFVDVTRGAAYLSQSCAPEAGWAEADILAIISRLSGSFQAYYWWKNAGLSGGELVLDVRQSRAGGGSLLAGWTRDHQGRAGCGSMGRQFNREGSRPEALPVGRKVRTLCDICPLDHQAEPKRVDVRHQAKRSRLGHVKCEVKADHIIQAGVRLVSGQDSAIPAWSAVSEVRVPPGHSQPTLTPPHLGPGSAGADVTHQAQHRRESVLQETQHRRECVLRETQCRRECVLQETQRRRECVLQETQRRRECVLQETQRRRESVLQETQCRRVCTSPDSAQESVLQECVGQVGPTDQRETRRKVLVVLF